jgi:hypothetical protein
METFEQRLEEINYQTELLKIKTQSLLESLLSTLDEDDLNGYDVNESEHIISIEPGTLNCEIAGLYDENTWDGTFEDMSQQDQLSLIKHVIENKLHEKQNK